MKISKLNRTEQNRTEQNRAVQSGERRT